MIAYYPFNGDANDESGNNLNGVVNGVTLTENRFGNTNSAFNFDGIDDYIEVLHNELLNLTAEWSYCAWVKIPENPNSGNRIIMHGEDFNDRHQESMSFFNTTQYPNKFYHVYEVDNGDGIAAYSTLSYPERNKWYFIVSTRDSDGNYRLYVNGLEDGYNFDNRSAASVQASIFIGVAVNDGVTFANYLKGVIDDIRIYNRTLTQQEITELFNEGTNTYFEYEYWIPYVDNTSGPSGFGSRAIINVAFDNTELQVDFDNDGIIDSVYTMQSGEEKWISYPTIVEGLHIYSSDPVDVSYFYGHADFGTYDDGVLCYTVPNVEVLGTDYWLPSPVTNLSILSTVDNNTINVNSTPYTLNKGEVQHITTLSGSAHITGTGKMMVVAANFDADRYGNTYAFTLLPTNSLGTVYYAPAEHPYNYQSPTSYNRVEIIATQNGTTLTIDTNNYSLNAGETLSYFTVSETTIQSDKPVYAVYISDIEAQDPWAGVMRHYSYAYSLVPASISGTKYILRKGKDLNSHGWPFIVEAIISLDDGNIIDFDANVDGTIDTTIVLNNGEVFYLSEGIIQNWAAGVPLLVEGSKKIQILDSYRSWWNGISEYVTGRIVMPLDLSPVTVVADDYNENNLPNVFEIQNYPNPFNPTTIIRYSIPQSGFITLKVFDVLGKEIKTLVNQEKTTGTYEIEFNAANLPSGIYFYRIQAGSFVETGKMILLK